MKTRLAAVLLALASIAAAETPVDFSGTWELNTDRGENLGMMKAVKETVVATQTDEQVVFAMTDEFGGNTTRRTVTYDLGGSPMQNKAAMGADSETVTSWAGNRLVTLWTAEGAILGTRTERREVRWLEAGGEELHVSMAREGNPPIVFVYERVE